MFLIIFLFVLMLGAGFFGYTQYAENQRLTNAIADARASEKSAKLDVLVRDHLLADLGKVVGETGTYKGRNGFDYSEYGTPPELVNVPIPSSITAKVTEFARDLKIPATLTNGIGNLLSQITVAYKAKSQEVDDAKGLVAKYQGEVKALNDKWSQSEQAHRQAVAAATQAHSELTQTINAEFNRKDNLINTMRAENQKQRSDLSAAQEQHKADQLDWQKKQTLLDARIAAAAEKNRLKNPPQAPDGRVLSASPATNLGYIDLGTKDMLPVGAQFEITDPTTGKVKGSAEVVKVERDRAEIRIANVADRFDYVVTGDLVSSPIYSPNLRRNIVLMGQFGYPYSREFVKASLEKLGNKVYDAVGPQVDLVILGDEPLSEDGDSFVKLETTEEFKRAQMLGIEFAPLVKIRGFLKQ